VDDWDPDSWRIEDFLDSDSDIANLADYQLRDEEVAWIDAWNYFVQNLPEEALPGFPLWQDDFKLKPKIPRSAPEWKRDFLLKNADFYGRHRSFINKWRKMSWIPGRDYKVEDFPASRRKFEWQARDAQPSAAQRDLWQLTLHFRPSGIRVRPATYLPTLVAINQTSIIGSRRRRITPREASRLQGIPDWVFEQAVVDDTTAYRQLGNGVNVGAVSYLARILFEDGGKTWGTPARDKRHSRKTGAQLRL
jgi:DNA (cytosine-5)-methyltransferase 1